MGDGFVTAMILGCFAAPWLYQHRTLFWGISGVIAPRASITGTRKSIVENLWWVMYAFAALLILTGVKMVYMDDRQPDIGSKPSPGERDNGGRSG